MGTPTGLVINNSSQFVISKGTHNGPSTLLMATEDGTITAWNSSFSGSNAVIVVDNSAAGAVYKGLAVAGSLIYAANFKTGKIDVFNANYQPTTVSGGFTDSSLPA